MNTAQDHFEKEANKIGIIMVPGHVPDFRTIAEADKCLGLIKNVLRATKPGNAENVEGFSDLTKADAKTFKTFLNNFQRGLSTKSKQTFIPKKIGVAKDDNGAYLRFDYELNNNAKWLCIEGPWSWY